MLPFVPEYCLKKTAEPISDSIAAKLVLPITGTTIMGLGHLLSFFALLFPSSSFFSLRLCSRLLPPLSSSSVFLPYLFILSFVFRAYSPLPTLRSSGDCCMSLGRMPLVMWRDAATGQPAGRWLAGPVM